MLQPGGGLAVLRFLRRDVDHSGGRCAAMPVLFAWRNPDDVAGLDLLDGLALRLEASNSRNHVERLSKRMRVPRGSRAGLEADTIDDDPRWRRRRDDRILPDRAGEVFGRCAARRPRAGGIDFHRYLPRCVPVCPVTSSISRSAPWSRHSWDRGPAVARRYSPR